MYKEHNQTKDKDGNPYFWKRKNSEDFLKYIKREAYDIGYLVCSLIITMYVNAIAGEFTTNKVLSI